MYFLTAFPDTEYFLWQTQVQHSNFEKVGINLQKVICLVSIRGNVSQSFLEYSKKTKAIIIFYQDDILYKTYIPTIRPNLIKKFMKDNPHFENEYLFLHDSDIIFRKLPDFESLKKENTWILADTKGYIGYQYLVSKGQKIIDDMCAIVGINKSIVVNNNESSGGGQYFGKGLDYLFWEKVEKDCELLYNKINNIEPYKEDFFKTNNVELTRENMIQSWTAGMWSELWNMWLFGFKTEINEEIDFSWATDNYERYLIKNIMHNAGATLDHKNLFVKGQYINKKPFGEDFSYVDKNTASYAYVKAIEETII